MATLKIKDVMAFCNCDRAEVNRWIKKGYLKAIVQDPEAYRSPYIIEESDFEAFLKSDNYKGYPEDIRHSRPFSRVPVLEDCYPINLLIIVNGLRIESEENDPVDVWGFDIRQFKHLISLLTDREQRIIQMRYQLGMTLDEIGAAFGIQKERVRQIQLKAQMKLKHWMIRKGCRTITQEEHENVLAKNRQLNAECAKLRIRLEVLTGSASNETGKEPSVNTESVRVEDMDFSVRAYNCIKRAGLDTLKDIIDFDMSQENYPSSHNWLTIRNLGRKSLMEIAKVVFEYCRYRIQYFSDGKYQGYIPILEGESLVVGKVEYYGGEV